MHAESNARNADGSPYLAANPQDDAAEREILSFSEWIEKQDERQDWDEMTPTEMMRLAFQAGKRTQQKHISCAEKCHSIALHLILGSSSADFATLLSWGQWCRDIAIMALENDIDSLILLEAHRIK